MDEQSPLAKALGVHDDEEWFVIGEDARKYRIHDGHREVSPRAHATWNRVFDEEGLSRLINDNSLIKSSYLSSSDVAVCKTLGADILTKPTASRVELWMKPKIGEVFTDTDPNTNVSTYADLKFKIAQICTVKDNFKSVPVGAEIDISNLHEICFPLDGTNEPKDK